MHRDKKKVAPRQRKAAINRTHSKTTANAVTTSPVDTNGNGEISLRSAIQYLNANGGGTITFAPGLTGPITLSQGELTITQAMTISGPGASQLTVDAGGNSRVFDVDDGSGTPDINVAITGLTLTGGNASGDSGGAILNAEILTLNGDTISGNQAGTLGGGIYNNGTANAVNNIVVGNTATTGGADVFGSFSISNNNQIGGTLSQILATDTNGNPLLANNGGPTQTIALVPGSPTMPNPAIGQAGALTTLSVAATDTTSTALTVSDATFLAVGDALKVDSEIVVVTAINGTTITVTRGADGSTAATHASGAGLFLAFDQRGLPRNANSDIGAFETQVPTVSIHVQNSSRVYNGAADPVSANVVGLNSATIATSPVADIAFAYYIGTLTASQVAGATPLTGAPVDVGSYTVVANFTSDVAGYRDASSAPADFSITPAVLTVTASDNSKVYGQTATDTGTISGVLNGDGITASFASTGDIATAAAPLGQYPIMGTPADGSGLAANYDVTLKPGTLTVGLPPGVGFLAGVPGDDTPQTFVRNLYRELLGREPSAGDMTYWTAQVQANSSAIGRQQVISAFMNSPEYKNHYVDTLYEVFLGRAAEAAGLEYWAAKMGNPGTPGGHGGSADEEFILAAIVGSDEFYADAGGTDQGFAQALYHDLLGRAGDTADVNALAGLLHSQEQNRDGIVRSFLDASETQHKLLDVFYPAAGGTTANPLPVPGAALPDSKYDLAIVTGLGWENLYLQGPYGNSPEGNDLFFTALAGGMAWDDVQFELLASDQFYTNPNRPVTA